MFDSLKAMGQIAGLMKNKEAIAEAMRRVRVNLEERTITVEAPSKAVRVVMSGSGKVLEVGISEEAARAAGEPAGREQLERLVAGAVNAATARTRQIMSEEVAREAKDLGLGDIPGIDKLAELM